MPNYSVKRTAAELLRYHVVHRGSGRLPTALGLMFSFAAALLLAKAVSAPVEATAESGLVVDALHSPLCKVPSEAIKACITGEARFHLEVRPGTADIQATVISVRPEALLSNWAACVARRWIEIFPETRLAPGESRDSPVRFSVEG